VPIRVDYNATDLGRAMICVEDECRMALLWKKSERVLRGGESTPAKGKERLRVLEGPQLTDGHKARRQHMEQESSQKLSHGKGHETLLVFVG
jgi:hypothetical protein